MKTHCRLKELVAIERSGFWLDDAQEQIGSEDEENNFFSSDTNKFK
jgi:hypothetical protein